MEVGIHKINLHVLEIGRVTSGLSRILKEGSVDASYVHPLGSTTLRWHNGSAHAKRRRQCTLYSYRKINCRD